MKAAAQPSGTDQPSPADGEFEEPRGADDRLRVDVAGFEGPLDLLLKLARDQKVDLARISILALAEQYLAFIEAARSLRLEIAADYLVMAAWLAYLKSRTLVPQDEADEEPSGEELAADLAARLRRLEAIRDAGKRLMALPQLGIERLGRGMPEAVATRHQVVWDAKLFDVLAAYGALRLRQVIQTVEVPKREMMSMAEARDRLTSLLGVAVGWAPLDNLLGEYLADPRLRASARASALSASLEMVREGELEFRQSEPFAPLYLRRRVEAEAEPRMAANG